MKQFFVLILLVISLTACKSIGRKYVTIEKNQDCCTLKIPVGNSEEKVELSIADNEFPVLKLSYSSAYTEAKNLKFIDAKLFIDGKEISPNKENYEADVFDAFRPQNYKPIAKEDCCENLEKKLGFDKSQAAEANMFGVKITKNYESLGNLPPETEVLLTAITDKGTFEKRWKLKLTTYERISDPIRFH